MTVTAEYNRKDGFVVEMGEDKHGLFVRCWNAEQEFHWEVRGVCIEDDGVRQKRRPYTKEEQLAEFNKWKD